MCAESLLFSDDMLLILKAATFQKRKHGFREDHFFPKATGRRKEPACRAGAVPHHGLALAAHPFPVGGQAPLPAPSPQLLVLGWAR